MTTPAKLDDFRRRRQAEAAAPPDCPETRALARLTTRQVLAELADHRRQLAHHGRRCWAGQQSRKRIAAAKLILAGRGADIPAGEEPAESLAELLRLFPPAAPIAEEESP